MVIIFLKINNKNLELMKNWCIANNGYNFFIENSKPKPNIKTNQKGK